MHITVSCEASAPERRERELAFHASRILRDWMVTPPPPSDRISIHDSVSAIVGLLVGTSTDRMGPSICDAGITKISEKVRSVVERQEPVRVHVMWGGVKHYVNLADQDIDAAELYAILQFRRLHDAIRRLYPPGLRVRFYLEDFGVAYEDGGGKEPSFRAAVWQGVERYCTRFEELVSALGGEFASCARFDAVCPRALWGEVTEAADRNLRALWSVWDETIPERGPDGDRQPRQTAKDELASLGWEGDIPSAMRAHYLKRLRSLYPAEELNGHVDRLLRYFAMVALYQQRGYFARDTASIKCAMYCPAPGIPQGRIESRLHLRTLSTQFSSQTMPPWTSLGCFEISRHSALPVMKIRSRKMLQNRSQAELPLKIEIESNRSQTGIALSSRLLEANS